MNTYNLKVSKFACLLWSTTVDYLLLLLPCECINMVDNSVYQKSSWGSQSSHSFFLKIAVPSSVHTLQSNNGGSQAHKAQQSTAQVLDHFEKRWNDPGESTRLLLDNIFVFFAFRGHFLILVVNTDWRLRNFFFVKKFRLELEYFSLGITNGFLTAIPAIPTAEVKTCLAIWKDN